MYSNAAGCNGGSDNAAYEWMMEHGLPTEEEYGSYANRVTYNIIYSLKQAYLNKKKLYYDKNSWFVCLF